MSKAYNLKIEGDEFVIQYHNQSTTHCKHVYHVVCSHHITMTSLGKEYIWLYKNIDFS